MNNGELLAHQVTLVKPPSSDQDQFGLTDQVYGAEVVMAFTYGSGLTLGSSSVKCCARTSKLQRSSAIL